jgi:hypothetical protein
MSCKRVTKCDPSRNIKYCESIGASADKFNNLLEISCDSPKTSKSGENKSLNIKPFDELKISTTTVMAYTNVLMNEDNQRNFFCTTPITIIDPPLTKKKKNIDKKKLRAPYGTIISLQYYPPPNDNECGVYFRGLRMSKKKSYWCSICQLYDQKGKKLKTVGETQCDVSEEFMKSHITEYEVRTFPPDTKKILFQCSGCNRYLKLTQLGEIVPFLNQVTVVMSIGDIKINTMIFGSTIPFKGELSSNVGYYYKNAVPTTSSFKIAGNKSFDNAVETIRLLWEEYIVPDGRNWTHTESRGNRSTDVHFRFETVMMNLDFSLGFSIDKKKLNNFMQKPEFKDKVFLSKYESTSVTHVNIKMYSPKPEGFLYYVLVYKKADVVQPNIKVCIDGYQQHNYCYKEPKTPYFICTPEKWYNIKKKPEKYTTLIVFSSSQTILTGRYPTNMEENYKFFVDLALKNKEEIMESVHRPKISIQEFLEQYEEKLLK